MALKTGINVSEVPHEYCYDLGVVADWHLPGPLLKHGIAMLASFTLEPDSGEEMKQLFAVLKEFYRERGQWLQFQGKMVLNDEYRSTGKWYVSGFSKVPVIVKQTPDRLAVTGSLDAGRRGANS